MRGMRCWEHMRQKPSSWSVARQPMVREMQTKFTGPNNDLLHALS